MELLLINHPLDCPICDKGGECPLQNQAMSIGPHRVAGSSTPSAPSPSRIPISTEVLLDRERCVLCQRCTRFSEQIAGDPFIELLERGAQQQIGVAEDKPFQSYFSGNTIQICPVGALTSAAYRFRSRPFDLVSTPSVCEHCASRLRERTDYPPRHRAAPAGRQRPRGQRGVDLRQGPLRVPLPHRAPTGSPGRWSASADGTLAETSWTEALSVAARGPAGRARGRHRRARRRPAHRRGRLRLRQVRPGRGGHQRRRLPRPRRTRPRSWSSSPRTSSARARRSCDYTRLEAAPTVLCVALEPEEESPIVFLRLRKAVRKHGQHVYHLGQWTTPAVERTSPSTGAAAPAGQGQPHPGRARRRGRGARRPARGRAHRARPAAA